MEIKEQVDTICMDCLNGKEEGALVVTGLVTKFGFNPEKIQQHKATIKALLDQLPLR